MESDEWETGPLHLKPRMYTDKADEVIMGRGPPAGHNADEDLHYMLMGEPNEAAPERPQEQIEKIRVEHNRLRGMLARHMPDHGEDETAITGW